MPADQCRRLSPPPWPHAPGRIHSPRTDRLLHALQVRRATWSELKGSWPMPSWGAAAPPETSRFLPEDGMHQGTYSITQRVVCTPSKWVDGRSLSKLRVGDSHLQAGRFVAHGVTHKIRRCNKGQKIQDAAAGEGTMKYLETFARILYLPACR